MLPSTLDAQIDRLSARDLEQLRVRVAIKLEAKKTPTTVEGDVYAQIVTLLKSMQHTTIPLNVLKKNQQSAAALKTGSEQLVAYINELFKPERKTDRINGIRMLVKMLVRHMTATGRVVSAHSVVRSLSWIPNLVDIEFPGYRENGFLHLLLPRYHATHESRAD